MKKITWFVVVVLIAAFMAGCGGSAAKGKNLKAGFVYVGPVGDAGWTKSHDDGRLAMEELDFVDESTYVENVPEGAEATRVITELAESGCDMIFTTSFGYMDPTLEVAEKYPNVKFLHATGYKTAENATNYMGRMYESKYLAGIVAGNMSKSGKLGYVAPFPIPEVVRLINAFTLGAQSVNPDISVQVLWTNSWFDPVHEKEAANTMIADGCDIITQGTDSAGPQEAAEAAGIYSIGYDSDMSMFAPKAHLTAPVWHWGIYYKDVATKIHNGTWTNDPIWWGIETGITGLSPYNEVVPQKVRDDVAKAKAAIIENDNIFTGPLYDNQGNLRVEEGVALTDGEKLSIQWFVKGVNGKIPKASQE
ncbi:MAG: BMP family ABC transporter substrate-binding protein [Candidatus Cloacimonadota bacterium]|nr:MAG: BMP family ABC transporter substrate-binding protein [Candidatus Cloacimonadota bacterium]RLC53772.1 MAG: BMP family ABC transporter substrate-binding protein [Candidatus Cloacimonadota bacterium]